MDIIEKIDNVLTATLQPLGIESFYGWYNENINATHVTFILITDNETNFSDNEAESIDYLIQVDIWSKENMEDLKKTIKTAMKGIDNCTYSDGADQYETDVKIYHKALRFNILEDI
jgi:predicted GTPase